MYNFFSILSLLVLTINIKLLGYQIPIWVILLTSFYLSKNITSNFYIFKLIRIIKNQFRDLKNLELKKLRKNNSPSRFTKYDFIKDLKPDIFYKRKLLINFLIYSVPLILSYLLSKFDTEMIELLKQSIETINKTITNNR